MKNYNIIVFETYETFEKHPNNIERYLKDAMYETFDCEVSAKICAGREQGYKGDLVEILLFMTEEDSNDANYSNKAINTLIKASKEYTKLLNKNIPF